MRKRMKIEDFWDYLPEAAKWIAMDKDGSWCRFDEKPTREDGYWFGEDYEYIGIPIDYDGDWKDSLHERPADHSEMIGMFGKGWSDDKEPADEGAAWGYLMEYNPDYPYHFYLTAGYYAHFRPCLPPARIEVKP